MERPTNASTIKVTLNLHITAICNYKCTACWATFRDVPEALDRDGWLRLIDEVGANRVVSPGYAVDKITFAGGEPTLVPWLPELVERAKRHGFITCIVTNGTRITDDFLTRTGPWLDWITFSLDSSDEDTNRRIGRGFGRHVRTILGAVARVRAHRGIRVRLNTVILAENHAEDMSDVVREIAPERWKVLQGTAIGGQNDGADDLLAVLPAQYAEFLHRHRALEPIPESTDMILGSYLMVDPMGRMFGNATGRHVYSDPVLRAGLARAAMQTGWLAERFDARGGTWAWGADVGAGPGGAP